MFVFRIQVADNIQTKDSICIQVVIQTGIQKMGVGDLITGEELVQVIRGVSENIFSQAGFVIIEIIMSEAIGCK